MSLRETAGELEKFFLEQFEPLEEVKLLKLERQLHHGTGEKLDRDNPQGLDKWSKKHAREVPHMGSIPYWPSIFRDQKIAKASRGITRAAIFLPQSAHLKAFRHLHNRVVGSAELADSMVQGFNTTPAYLDTEGLNPELPGEEASLTDFAIAQLEAGASFGVTSGHPDKLSDIGEFTAAQSIAVAERVGTKYLGNFKVLVNKNMARETYKNIPIAWIMSSGIVPYWGLPPGESMDENGIPEDVEQMVNKILIDQYRKDRKLGSVVLGFVPSGSRMAQIYNKETGELERLDFKRCYTGSFMTRCDAGIIPANRFGDKFEIGSIIPTRKPDGKTVSKDVLTDRVMEKQARQVARLSGLTVSYERASGPEVGKTVLVDLKEAA